MDAVSYVLVALLLGFVAVQLVPFLRARRLRGAPAPEFGDLVAGAPPPRLLLYFGSARCGMCRAMDPVIDALARERGGAVVKIDVGERLDVARRFGVMATPTTVLVRDGRIAEVLLGAQPEARLRRLLD